MKKLIFLFALLLSSAQINSVVCLTPSTALAGFKCLIKDTDVTALQYEISSDGISWAYNVKTTAL